MNKKLKVVWICHFYNNEIQNILKPRKRMPEKAPWITIGIKEAEKRNDIELHVVAPHRWISGTREFDVGNVHYHFFNPGIPYYGRHWPGFFRFDVWTNYRSNKRKVKKIVERIKPDIIHLHGLENAYYSSTVLQYIEKYPIFSTIQGFISLQIDKGDKLTLDTKSRLDIEKELLQKTKIFGVYTEHMKNEILRYNPNAKLLWHEYFLNIPSDKPITITEKDKKYDIIYFARITKEKGIEDLIKVTGVLSKTFLNIKVAIIGSAKKEYINKLKDLAIKNNCLKNLEFKGFLPSQENVYSELLKSKICVLPTYNDTIPGTIMESMFRKIPVVSYKTGGIPAMNKKEEVLLLSEQGDINGLYENIKLLLLSEEKRTELAEKAYQYAINRWNNEKAMEDIISIYKKILDNNCRS